MLATPAAAALWSSCPSAPTPSVPSNPAHYAYVNTYYPRCASRANWNRSLTDVTISTLVDGQVPVSVTTSTALGGAIASLKGAGKEYISSGGHGAALQYSFHAWQVDTLSGGVLQGSAGHDQRHQTRESGPNTGAELQPRAAGYEADTRHRWRLERTRPVPRR